MQRKAGVIGILLLLMMATVNFAQAQSENPREMLNQYIADLQRNPNDYALREKIIRLVQEITPPPAVPDEARRFAVRGQTAFADAKSVSDFEEAAKEFSKALLVAPWWAEGYNNLAVAQEKARQFGEAIRNLKLYLLASPNAPDTEKIKDQIYALEYKQEAGEREAKAKEAERRERARYEWILGRWNGRSNLRKRVFAGIWDPLLIEFSKSGDIIVGCFEHKCETPKSFLRIKVSASGLEWQTTGDPRCNENPYKSLSVSVSPDQREIRFTHDACVPKVNEDGSQDFILWQYDYILTKE